MNERIGILGLGLIGMALAGRLLASGRPVLGHDPDPDRMRTLTGAGGQSVSADQVWAGADLVISAVFDTDQLQDVIAAAPENTGKRLMTVSTCDPARVPGLGARAAAKGLELVEAPLSGTSQQLADGDAVFLIGADAATVRDLGPLFEILGKAHHHVGGLGTGNCAKLAINLVLGLNRAAVAQGLVFARQMGMDPARFLELARGSAAASQVMDIKGPLMVEQSFAPQGRIAQSAKDFKLILQAANSSGLRLPFAETYAAMMQDCIDHGEIDLDNSAVFKALDRARASPDDPDPQ